MKRMISSTREMRFGWRTLWRWRDVLIWRCHSEIGPNRVCWETVCRWKSIVRVLYISRKWVIITTCDRVEWYGCAVTTTTRTNTRSTTIGGCTLRSARSFRTSGLVFTNQRQSLFHPLSAFFEYSSLASERYERDSRVEHSGWDRIATFLPWIRVRCEDCDEVTAFWFSARFERIRIAGPPVNEKRVRVN